MAAGRTQGQKRRRLWLTVISHTSSAVHCYWLFKTWCRPFYSQGKCFWTCKTCTGPDSTHSLVTTLTLESPTVLMLNLHWTWKTQITSFLLLAYYSYAGGNLWHCVIVLPPPEQFQQVSLFYLHTRVQNISTLFAFHHSFSVPSPNNHLRLSQRLIKS
jgi:hypothetical protein